MPFRWGRVRRYQVPTHIFFLQRRYGGIVILIPYEPLIDGMALFGKKSDKVRIMFLDEMNDLQSQIAEYFAKELYSDRYEIWSAGPKFDFIDCELISVMYQNGYDIRSWIAKDFKMKKMPQVFDYLIFLEKATYDRIKDVVPYDAKQICVDFGRKTDWNATDDKELYDCYVKLIEDVRVWVKDALKDPDGLESMVVRD